MARGKSTGTVHQSEKQAPSLAATALDNFPKTALDRRREFIDHADALVSEAKKAAQKVGEHKKRLTDVFNTEACVLKWIGDVRKLTPDKRARALRQFHFLLKDFDLSEQLDLFNDKGEAGGLTAEPDKPVFDKTGNKAAPKASETEPEKKLTGAEPPRHVPSPAVPLDEALEKLNEAKAEAEAKRGGKPLHVVSEEKGTAEKKTLVPPGAAASTSSEKKATPKPPGGKTTPKPPAERTADAVAKASTKRMSRAPTPSEASAIADKYIPKPADLPPGDEDEAPGNFSVH